MASERRNDIGSKVMVSVIGILVGMLMTISYQASQNALEMAHANEVKIGCLETKIDRLPRIESKIDALLQRKEFVE